jgi:beta-lactam-binding protein with PASTA domain
VRAARLLLVAVALLAFSAACGKEENGPDNVVVPLVTQTNVTSAYDLLHEAGLRVAIPQQFRLEALQEPGPRKQSPRAGARVPGGTVVTLTLWGGPLGSPRGGVGKHTLADFGGTSVSEAVRWIDDHDLFWKIAVVPPLPPSDEPHLLDAYVVTGQRPAPGSELARGILHKGGGYQPTPVALFVKLARN